MVDLRFFFPHGFQCFIFISNSPSVEEYNYGKQYHHSGNKRCAFFKPEFQSLWFLSPLASADLPSLKDFVQDLCSFRKMFLQLIFEVGNIYINQTKEARSSSVFNSWRNAIHLKYNSFHNEEIWPLYEIWGERKLMTWLYCLSLLFHYCSIIYIKSRE